MYKVQLATLPSVDAQALPSLPALAVPRLWVATLGNFHHVPFSAELSIISFTCSALVSGNTEYMI